MTVVNPSREVAEAIIEAGGEALKTCYQCGLCTGTCPWNLVRTFLTRRLIHEAQLGLTELENEDIWLCATCRACVDRCPRGVEIIDIMKALRRIGNEWGAIPKTLKTVMTSLSSVGNPFGEPREKRLDWAKSSGVNKFTPDMDYLYFSCCTPAYDKRTQRIATSTSKVLNKAGISFGILGMEESCCGESARKSGEETLFQTLAKNNIDLFKKHGVKRIIASSPHSYHTIKNEYPQFGSKMEVYHTTQLLDKLIREGKIKPVKVLNKKVAYHDPCYLGRHNKIYDEPRNILRSIPGLELIELPDNRETSLCCGGGGGRIWMETKKGERFSDIRIEQAVSIGADILVTACPYCTLNFDDSLLTTNKEGSLAVKDIFELVNEVL